MSQLCLLICRVEDEDGAAADAVMTELARVDLPAAPGTIGTTLDTLETQVATVGQRVRGRLVDLQWEEIDAQAVAQYRACHRPGSVVADGDAPLLVASRFGTLELRRQVLARDDGRPHCLPGDDLLAAHQGLLITRGLAEQACLLSQDLPFATAARLLGWQIGEPQILSATTLRTLARAHGARIRCLEQGEATYLLSTRTQGQHLGGVPVERPRRHPGWPTALSAAVEAALSDGQRRPPAGVSHSDWDRVREAHAVDPALPVAALQRLGPVVAPGQMLLILDEVLTRTQEQGQFHELRTACLLTTDGRRYLSGTGLPFLRQVQAAVHACCAQALLVVADGAGWIRTFFRDHLAAFPHAETVLDWSHLAKKCRDLAARICPQRDRRNPLRRRLLRALWGGNVPRAVRILLGVRPQAADPEAVDTLCTYLHVRREWIPDYRRRRCQRQFIGNGLGEKADDRIVVRRQKRRGMHGVRGPRTRWRPCARCSSTTDGTPTGMTATSFTWRQPSRIPGLLRAYLYHAFRELGRAVRTGFLLRYLSDSELRATIQAALNKNESFNNYTQWVAFGGEGLIAENDRAAQRKIVKYNQLLSNCLIFYTVAAMSRVLADLRQEGYPLDADAVAALSPYITTHLTRFGRYSLDLARIPAALDYDLPILSTQPRVKSGEP